MAGPIKDPQVNQQPKDTNIDLMDVADFLFGVKSIERIVKGEGSWGDLINVGVTAATFLIPPAKLLKLSPSALNKVIKASEKTAEVKGISVAAKRAAQTTAENANQLKRMRITEESTERLKDYPAMTTMKGKSEIPEPDLTAGRYQVTERTTPTEAALNEKPGVIEPREKKYTWRERNPDVPKDADVLRITEDNADLPMPQELERVVPNSDAAVKRYLSDPNRSYLKKKYDELNAEMPVEKPKVPKGEAGPGKVPVIVRERFYDKEADKWFEAGDIFYSHPNKLSTIPAIPKQLEIAPEVDKLGYSLYKSKQLDIANRSLGKNKDPKSLNIIADNKRQMELLNEDIRKISKGLTQEERGLAAQQAEEIAKFRSKFAVKTQKINKTKAEQILPETKPVGKPVLETRPTEDEIFVFGSNLEGRHGAGAAKFARDNYGAEYGNPSGIQGQSYAIPTKDLKTNKGLELSEIKKNIDEFLNYAEANPDKKFFFSAIGTGLAGHSPQSIAGLITRTPSNVRFDPKIGNLIKTKSTVNKVDDVTIQSGGAAGADTVWAAEADKLGIKSVAHSFKEHSMQGTRPKLETRNVLTTEQLKEADVALKKANQTLKRPTSNLSEYVRNLFRRNYYQVKDSEAVIAVGKILPEGKLVDGGTGWAVQMGIDMNKQVYVYDQFVKTWAKWNGNKFQKIDGLPPKFNNFAGIGSRNLQKEGELAIKEYLQMIAKGK